MGRDRVLAVRGAVHDAVAVGQARLDDHLHAFEQLVVGRVEQRAVEGEVRLDGVRGGGVLVHGLQGGVQGGHVGVGAALGGEADGRGFDDGADLGEVAQQGPIGPVGPAALELPAQHVGVEKVPVGAGAHERAAFLPGVDHALGGEHLQRLAQGRETDVEFALQGDEIQRRAFRELPAQDAAGQGFHGLAVHASAGVGGHVVLPFCCGVGGLVMRTLSRRSSRRRPGGARR